MKTILFGIVFILMGLVSCGIAFYLGRPESIKKAPISKPSSKIFYLIGALTFALGLILIIFANDFTKKAFQLSVIIYLACLTILLFVYTRLIKRSSKNETNNS